MNLEFFDLLYADTDFCEAMGRATLAAGHLESTLYALLAERGVTIPRKGASFGRIIGTLQKHKLISENAFTSLKDVKEQRNYLTHCLFDLFSGRIAETMVPGSDLVPLDVVGFTEMARQLEENMRGLSMIVERRLGVSAELGPATNPDRLLLR